ncbi:MAG: NAD-dependent succinate-semialdehyde dehydrogenase [Verrucomicrobia bacterium]|nr:NAD-dependent succinate-semialdehyde dehydrogenase [Verrucomicrobiota bacterium]
MRTKAYIDGKWVGGKKTFKVFDPYSGKEIAKIPDLGVQDAKRAIAAAHKAFAKWSVMPAQERSDKLVKMACQIEKRLDELARILTLEQGKPLEEAKFEILWGVKAMKWMAEEGCRIHGYASCDPDPDRSAISIRQPVGVVSAITPWNFPFYVPLKTFAALAAGCTLVLKPAEDTPICSLMLADLAEEAGIPKGVFNVITCKDPRAVGNLLATHPIVKKVTFTGSTEVGKHLLKMGADTIKNTTMELGGNCPLLVFDDADLDKAVEGAFNLKFLNNGQCCNGLNRFLVQDSVYDAFVKKCEARAKKITCGSGFKKVNLGPLINENAKKKVIRLVNDAVAKGAKPVLYSQEKGLLCSPILLRDANTKMAIWREEIFGPVIAVYRFKTEEDAIRMANDTRYGLAAYFYSEGMKRCMRVARALEAGIVGVNTTNAYSITLPFGGWKESGIGREGGIVESLNAYCELKAISFAR